MILAKERETFEIKVSLDNLISQRHKAIQTEISQLSATDMVSSKIRPGCSGLDTAGPENPPRESLPSISGQPAAVPSTLHGKHVSPKIILHHFKL